ncbi:hypothetical protein D3C72_2279200 [compost metagenome]
MAVETQEVKVYSLKWKGNSIEVRDARDTPYIIEAETGKMTKPARPIIYPAGTSVPEPTPSATPKATVTATPTPTATPAAE